MAVLKVVLAFLWAIVRALLYGWILGLWQVLREIWLRCRRAWAKKCLPGRQGKASPKDCVTLSNPAVKRPDPLIYDQYYLMALGFAVTWDNPDIWLELGGVVVPSEKLLPDTLYEVVARIWNGSTEGVVAGLPVHFSYLSFGGGVVSHPVTPGPADVSVNLGVKGGPGCPAFARTQWRTPAGPGHYCLQVSFSWVDDANPYNNLGQENTVVGVSHSPVRFEFQLRNDKRFAQQFRFEVDAYVIPPVPECGGPNRTHATATGTGNQKPFGAVRVPPQHDRRNYPLPVGWSVSFLPASPQLNPGEEIKVLATVIPAPGFRGRQAVNVHLFADAGLAGGMTFYVEGS